jgi:hypothetical protein
VLVECEVGDAEAAAARLAVLVGIPLLDQDHSVLQFARRLVEGVRLPHKAEADSLHIATAAVHRIQYLVTWNCTHIANATLRPMIDQVCRSAGFDPPIICTPEELNDV